MPDVLSTDPNQPVFSPGGGIADAVRIPGMLETYAIGNDGKLWSAGSWKDGSWNEAFPVVQSHNQWSFAPGGGIAAVSRNSALMETFTIGSDGKLWSPGYWVNGMDWQPALPIVPKVASNAVFKPGGGIAAIARHPAVLDTFAIGYDGSLWDVSFWNAQEGWHAAYAVPNGGNTFEPGGGVAAAAPDQNTLYTFTIGNDGQLWSPGYYSNNSWHPAFKVLPTDPNVHFPVGAQVAATVHGSGLIDVWTIGGDGQLWNAGSCNWSAGTCFGSWGLPYKVQTSSAVFKPGGGIGAASRTGGLIDVEAIGYDDHTWSVGWYGYSYP
jgi:hypothetical protein